MQFRSTRQCTAFKARWEAEVSRRENSEFVLICVYGCIGLQKREGSKAVSAKKSKRSKKNTKSSREEDDLSASASDVTSSIPEIKTPPKKKGFRRALNPLEWKISGSTSSDKPPAPPSTPEPDHARTPSVALQNTIVASLSDLDPTGLSR